MIEVLRRSIEVPETPLSKNALGINQLRHWIAARLRLKLTGMVRRVIIVGTASGSEKLVAGQMRRGNDSPQLIHRQAQEVEWRR